MNINYAEKLITNVFLTVGWGLMGRIEIAYFRDYIALFVITNIGQQWCSFGINTILTW